jgi:hypothetical protein
MGLYVVVLFSGGVVVVLVLLLFESRPLSLLGGGGGCGTLNDFFSSTDISGGFDIIGVCLFFVEAISEDFDRGRLLKTDKVFLRKRLLGNKLQMQHMKDTNDVRVNTISGAFGMLPSA